MIVRELITLFGFDTDDAGVKHAADAFATLKAKTEVVKLLWESTVGVISDIVAETTELASAAVDASDRLGVTAEAVQELGFAAEQSGGSQESMMRTLQRLSVNAAEAAQGNKAAAKSFAALKINVKDSTGALKTADRLLEEMADGIAKTSDAAERTRLAQALGGRGATGLLPLLVQGSAGIRKLRGEAEDLGFVVDNKTAASFEAYGDTVQRLDLALRGIRTRIAAGVLPVFAQAAEGAIKWLAASRALIDSGIKALVKVVEGTFAVLTKMGQIVDENRQFWLQLAAVFAGTYLLGGIQTLIGMLRALTLAEVGAAIGAAIPVIAFLGLAAVIALVIDDIQHFLRGEGSALGDWLEVFGDAAKDPKANWIVKTMAAIITATADALKATDGFFANFFEEAEELGGVEPALMHVFDTAIGYWKNQFRGLWDELWGAFLEGYKEALLPDLFKFAVKSRLPGGDLIFDVAEGVRNRIPAFAGGGLTPETAPPILQSLPGDSGGQSIVFEGSSIEQTINVPMGSDAQSIGDVAGEALQSVLEEDRRTAARQLEANGRGLR